jgi:fructose-bisphosphate aldolase class II
MLLDPVQSNRLLTHALEHGYAVLAVNADSPAAVNDCLEAARRCRAPVIIEASLWQLTGHSFGMGDALLGLARYLTHLAVMAGAERFREVPVLFHTDHLRGPEALPLLKRAIEGVPLSIGGTGVTVAASTISLDSSQLTEEENLAAARELCAHAAERRLPLTLELEAGVDDGLTPLDVTERLLGGVEERYPGRVALWAPGLGTRHGYSPEGYPAFAADHGRQHRLTAQRVTGRPIGIALHGSSGLDEAALRSAVAAGVVKLNWSTESLHLRSAAAREYFHRFADRLERSHPDFKATAMDDGLQRFVSEQYVPRVMERVCLLGGEGRAPAIKESLMMEDVR